MSGRQDSGSPLHQHRHCDMQKTLVTRALLSTALILKSADLADDALDQLDDVGVGPRPSSDGFAEQSLGGKHAPLDDDASEDEAAAGHAGVVEDSHLNQ